MPLTLDTLKSEIDTDPTGLGFSGKDASAIAALLNDPTKRKVRQSIVLRGTIKTLMLANQKLLPILASNATSATIIKTLFGDPDYLRIDVDDPTWRAVLDMLKADTLIDDADKTAILALGDQPISRAFELWGATIPASMVTAAQSASRYVGTIIDRAVNGAGVPFVTINFVDQAGVWPAFQRMLMASAKLPDQIAAEATTMGAVAVEAAGV